MNFIQTNSKKIKYFTNLKEVANWLEINFNDYDWHFSDIDGGWNELTDPSWVKGEDLQRKLDEVEYQFDWAVISAFRKGTSPFLDVRPYADGNTDFWNGKAHKQLKNALFEIVCWDSSATLFIDLPKNLAEKLFKNAPGIRKLK